MHLFINFIKNLKKKTNDKILGLTISEFIKSYNTYYGLLAFETGRAAWFKKLPLFARILILINNIDEDLMYVYHLYGVTWSKIVYSFLRYGVNIVFIVTHLQNIINLRLLLIDCKRFDKDGFIEYEIIHQSLEILNEVFVEWKLYYNYNNFIEKLLFFYFEFIAEEQPDFIRLLGVDPIVRNLFMLSYCLQMINSSLFHSQKPVIRIPWQLVEK